MNEDFGSSKVEETGHWKGGVEEEKKECTPQRPHRGVSELQTKVGSDNQIDNKQSDLPDVLQGVIYEEENKLLADLENNGIRDLPIVLDDDGYAVWREMPSDAHNHTVRKIEKRFLTWKKQQSPGLSCDVECETEVVNVKITRSFSPKRKGAGIRLPDCAIFGPDRLDIDGLPKMGGEDNKFAMNPHVIIQFGWTNDVDYEEYAIDDMMNYAGVGSTYGTLGRPNVAYLIKALWKKDRGDSPVTGFQVYEVRQDERRKNVTPEEYCVGGDGEGEKLEISISAEDMGIPASAGGGDIHPFTIDVHEIRRMLERKNHATFEEAEE